MKQQKCWISLLTHRLGYHSELDKKVTPLTERTKDFKKLIHLQVELILVAVQQPHHRQQQ